MGNLDSLRDWGHAKDYVEMQWMMLQNSEPEDYVISTGRMETVRRFCELSAIYLGWQSSSDNSKGIIWEGKGIEGKGSEQRPGAGEGGNDGRRGRRGKTQ